MLPFMFVVRVRVIRPSCFALSYVHVVVLFAFVSKHVMCGVLDGCSCRSDRAMRW